MNLIDFLKNQTDTLEIFTDDIEIRDYFINVVPVLFDTNVIVNKKNIFGEYQVNKYNTVLLATYSERLSVKPKHLYQLKDNEVIEITQTEEQIKFDITEPIKFFKLLTI
jgi:hypothetical protein